ncbi:MAG: Spy/CpxP family protein refolding chaperone [Stenomitos rutilans HA7619-LM2]|jgi:Spy/CpxP family protein refolding chaperone|nr:Spy/CpxP family protein refolding chaperone [Stenomitos rutilans HA7619-LM2]
MSPRHLSILAAAVVLLGGAVAIANPLLRLQPIAQTPTASPSQTPSNQATPDQMSPNHRDGWLKDLNLSADQVQKMRAIRNQYQDKIGQGRQAVRQSRQELQALMAGDATEAQIRAKYNQVKTLKQQVADAQFESILATRNVLNPEQRRKFASRMLKRQSSGDRPQRGERGPL